LSFVLKILASKLKAGKYFYTKLHSWGDELCIVNNKYCAKFMVYKSGEKDRYHYHPTRTETFFVLTGRVTLKTSTIHYLLNPGEYMTVEPCIPHRVIAHKSSVILLTSTHNTQDDHIYVNDPLMKGK